MDILYAGKTAINHIIDLLKKNYITKDQVVDNCESNSSDAPLSANQGRVINEKIERLSEGVSSEIATHNANTSAHADIREQINQLSSEKVVLYTEQTLTDEQKEQARKNIGAENEVYVGSGEMPEGYNVQIDPSGEATEILTEEDVNALINSALGVIENGSY